MKSTLAQKGPTAGRGFQHEALFYAGPREFVERTVPFLREGLDAGEPILVVVDSGKITALRTALGEQADRVQFADMSEVGRNPARIIYHWQRFIDDHLGEDRPVRGIGEPIWAGRNAAELVECQAHETLLNLAFAGTPAWSLMCPYDVATLPPPVVAEARRSHPVLVTGAGRGASVEYLSSHPSPARLDVPLPPPPTDATTVPFGPGLAALRTVRQAVLHHCQRARLGPGLAEDLLLAANEIAANSLQHGGGTGTLRLWADAGTVVCQVDDPGRWRGSPMQGRLPASPDQDHGRGLWLVNQLCHLVQIRSTPAGTTVRLHFSGVPRPHSG